MPRSAFSFRLATIFTVHKGCAQNRRFYPAKGYICSLFESIKFLSSGFQTGLIVPRKISKRISNPKYVQEALGICKNKPPKKSVLKGRERWVSFSHKERVIGSEKKWCPFSEGV